MGLGRVKSHLESNIIPTRDAQRAQTKPCAHQETPHWARPAFECWASPAEVWANRMKNHNHRKLIKLIIWMTALFNSMKLWAKPWPLGRATQDKWVMVESSDRMWSTGKGNGKSLQHSCLENPMNSMKRQNDRILKGTPQVSRCPICYWRSVEKKEWRDGAKAKTRPSCGCDWWYKQGLML